MASTATAPVANRLSTGQKIMTHSDRVTARIVGFLILTATVTYMVGSGLLASVVAVPDLLLNVAPNRGQVATGVLLEYVNAAAIATVGIMLFPVLRRHSQAIALGYAGARIIECTMLIVAGVSSLLLIPLSQEYIQAGTSDSATLISMAELLLVQSNFAFHFAMIALGVGSIPLCYLLYRTRLIPRSISVLGIIGYATLIANGVLVAFGNDMGVVLFLPGAIFEIAFPVWLIVKGFNASPTRAATA